MIHRHVFFLEFSGSLGVEPWPFRPPKISGFGHGFRCSSRRWWSRDVLGFHKRISLTGWWMVRESFFRFQDYNRLEKSEHLMISCPELYRVVDCSAGKSELFRKLCYAWFITIHHCISESQSQKYYLLVGFIKMFYFYPWWNESNLTKILYIHGRNPGSTHQVREVVFFPIIYKGLRTGPSQTGGWEPRISVAITTSSRITSAGPEASRADAGPDPNSVDSRTLEDAPKGAWDGFPMFFLGGEWGCTQLPTKSNITH